MLRDVPKRERWFRRPPMQGKGRGTDGWGNEMMLEMGEKYDGWLVLLITVYYLGIGNAKQTNLTMKRSILKVLSYL